MIVGPDRIDEAVAVLRRGGLVAFPTETVYGLGANASDPRAVLRIFEAKGRPADHPVIVHLPSEAHLDRWAVDVPQAARTLAARCWPGALTLVLRKAPRVPREVTGGLSTVGLRVPAQPIALSLLTRFDGGIAAPSANRFGRVSPTRAEDVLAELGDSVDLVIDGGPCRIGVESTILDMTVTPPTLLRPGGVAAETLERLLEMPIAREPQGPARAPGMLETHYAPNARVEILEVEEATRRVRELLHQQKRVGVFACERFHDMPSEAFVLLPARDAEDYAHSLYARLREADRLNLQVLVAVPPPEEGIGTAIRDRLRRAAASSGPWTS